jgi:hypothetical protein
MPVEGLLFGAAYGNCAGKVSDARTALRWYPSQVFGYGLALNRTRIDFECNNGDVSLDSLLEGASVFTAFTIPGLQ